MDASGLLKNKITPIPRYSDCRSIAGIDPVNSDGSINTKNVRAALGKIIDIPLSAYVKSHTAHHHCAELIR